MDWGELARVGALYGGLTLGDHLSGQRAFAAGAQEVGPLASRSYSGAMAARTVLPALGDVLLRDHKRSRWAYRGVCVVGTGLVVAHNMRLGREGGLR